MRCCESSFFAAAEGRGQQAERRRHGLDHQVQQHAHDDAAHREFGVVQRTRDRQVDVDVAARVLQQRHGQQHRQLGGVRAVGLVAKGQLVQHHVVGCLQRAVLDLVFQVHRELAALDRITHVLGRVRVEARQVHALGRGLQTRPVTLTLAGWGLVDDTAVIAPSIADSSAT
ncbi:hypothetical protein G6F24_016024 [Rhizopus arrhizus]|nr:hypothetical protein G6F24_016024 [Rhizopus arrhizus]